MDGIHRIGAGGADSLGENHPHSHGKEEKISQGRPIFIEIEIRRENIMKA